MGARYTRAGGYSISSRAAPRRMAPKSAKAKLPLGSTVARILGLAVIAVIAIFMISASSSNSTAAYGQNALRKQIGAADGDIERLKLEAQRATSLGELQRSPVKDGLVPMEPGEVAGVSTAAP